MKIMDITLWDIPLRVTFYRYEVDQYDPQNGHYTTPGKWHIETIEHKGVDISDIVSDEVWHILEKEANDGH